MHTTLQPLNPNFYSSEPNVEIELMELPIEKRYHAQQPIPSSQANSYYLNTTSHLKLFNPASANSIPYFDDSPYEKPDLPEFDNLIQHYLKQSTATSVSTTPPVVIPCNGENYVNQQQFMQSKSIPEDDERCYQPQTSPSDNILSTSGNSNPESSQQSNHQNSESHEDLFKDSSESGVSTEDHGIQTPYENEPGITYPHPSLSDEQDQSSQQALISTMWRNKESEKDAVNHNIDSFFNTAENERDQEVLNQLPDLDVNPPEDVHHEANTENVQFQNLSAIRSESFNRTNYNEPEQCQAMINAYSNLNLQNPNLQYASEVNNIVDENLIQKSVPAQTNTNPNLHPNKASGEPRGLSFFGPYLNRIPFPNYVQLNQRLVNLNSSQQNNLNVTSGSNQVPRLPFYSNPNEFYVMVHRNMMMPNSFGIDMIPNSYHNAVSVPTDFPTFPNQNKDQVNYPHKKEQSVSKNKKQGTKPLKAPKAPKVVKAGKAPERADTKFAYNYKNYIKRNFNSDNQALVQLRRTLRTTCSEANFAEFESFLNRLDNETPKETPSFKACFKGPLENVVETHRKAVANLLFLSLYHHLKDKSLLQTWLANSNINGTTGKIYEDPEFRSKRLKSFKKLLIEYKILTENDWNDMERQYGLKIEIRDCVFGTGIQEPEPVKKLRTERHYYANN